MIEKSKTTIILLLSIFTGLFDTFQVGAVKKVRSAQRKKIKKKQLKNKRKRGRNKGGGKKKQGGDRTRSTTSSVMTGGGESVKMVDQKQEDKNEMKKEALRIDSKKREEEKTENSGERKRSQGVNQERTIALVPSNVGLSIPLTTSLIKSTIKNQQVDDGGGQVLVVSAEQKKSEDESLSGEISTPVLDNLAPSGIGNKDQFNFKNGGITSTNQSQDLLGGGREKVAPETITGWKQRGLSPEKVSSTQASSGLRDFSPGSDSGLVSFANNNKNTRSLVDNSDEYFSETEPLIPGNEMQANEQRATGGWVQGLQGAKKLAERFITTVEGKIKGGATNEENTSVLYYDDVDGRDSDDYFSETETLLSKNQMKANKQSATGVLDQKWAQMKQSAAIIIKTVEGKMKGGVQSVKDTVAKSAIYESLKNPWGGTNKVSEKKSEIP